MIEKRMFYIVLSCTIVFMVIHAKKYLETEERSEKERKEHAENKQTRLIKYYEALFEAAFSISLNKKSSLVDNIAANNTLRNLEINMRKDGFDAAEIGEMRHKGYRKICDLLKKNGYLGA